MCCQEVRTHPVERMMIPIQAGANDKQMIDILKIIQPTNLVPHL